VLRDDLGIDYRLEPWEGTLAGWQARVAHGDGMRGRADRGYRAIRPVLRHRLSQWAFRHLPPDAATRLAVGSSQASRTYRPADDGLELRRVAVATLQADPALELLVLGHSHVAGLERAPSGGVYANPGSWLDAPTYLMVEPGSIALCRWDGSAEGDRVHVLDRGPEKAPGHT